MFSNIQLAYFAGLFDGEGHVYIKTEAKKRGIVSLQCGIGMTDPEPLAMLYREYEGTFIQESSNSPHLDIFRWRLTTKKAERFLKDILPFSLVKAPQIRLSLEFCANCIRDRSNRTIRLTDAEIELREYYRNQLHEMKKIKLSLAEVGVL